MSQRHFLRSLTLLVLISILILQLCLAAPQFKDGKDDKDCKDRIGTSSKEDDSGEDKCDDEDDDDNDGLNALGIIGIIVGIILFGLGVAALACYCCVCCCCTARANRTTSRGHVIAPRTRGVPPPTAATTISGDMSKQGPIPDSVNSRPQQPPAYENYERKVEPTVADSMVNLHRVIYSEPPPTEAGLDYPPAYHEIDLNAPNAPPPDSYYGGNDTADPLPTKH